MSVAGIGFEAFRIGVLVMARFGSCELTSGGLLGCRSNVFFKVTKSGPRSYVQLVEAFRDEAGRPKSSALLLHLAAWTPWASRLSPCMRASFASLGLILQKRFVMARRSLIRPAPWAMAGC